MIWCLQASWSSSIGRFDSSFAQAGFLGDLVTIKEDVFCAGYPSIFPSAVSLEENTVTFREVTVGKRAVMGFRSCLMPGTVMQVSGRLALSRLGMMGMMT